MSWTVHLSPQAQQDIREIFEYTLIEFGPLKYAEYESLFLQALGEIAEDPDGVHCKTRDDLAKNARVMHLSRRGRPARH